MSLRGEGPRGSFLGEGRGGLLLGRFYFSKWLTFPVLGHKKVRVFMIVKYQVVSEIMV